MQISTLGWRRDRESGPDQWNRKRESFYETHQIGAIIRGLFFSSALWGLLAVGVYSVYAMVLGTH